MFRLPAYQELSKEQDTVTNLSINGIHLVAGPPGTGKTVVAIYRANMFREAGLNSSFIVYNNTLNQYLDVAIKEKSIETITSTYHSWLGTWYRRTFKRNLPQLKDFVYDWNEILMQLARRGDKIERFSYLVLDEGQDLPAGFYSILPLIAENITVFADENQRITDQNTTIEEIKNALGVNKVSYLTRNYRNTHAIAEFAAQFYSGLPSGIPALPDRQGPKPRLMLGRNYREQIDIIARYARNNPRFNIGVFLPTQRKQYGFFAELKKSLNIPIQMYQSGKNQYKHIDFRNNGVYVLCYPSTKGLEFDAVFIPELQDRRTDANPDDEKMRFYVLTSRAREDLVLFSRADKVPLLMRYVPDNLYQKY